MTCDVIASVRCEAISSKREITSRKLATME